MSEEIFNLIQDRKNLDTVSSDDLSEMGKLCQELVTLKHDVKQTELQFKAKKDALQELQNRIANTLKDKNLY